MVVDIEKILGKKRSEIPFGTSIEYVISSIETMMVSLKSNDWKKREYLNWASFFRDLSNIDGLREDFGKVADYLTRQAEKYK